MKLFFFAIHTSELCLFFLWVFSRNTSDFTIYSGKAPFYWPAPQHCPPQDPFPRFVHRRGLTLALTLLKRDCVSEWLGQEHGGGECLSKAFWEGGCFKESLPGPWPWEQTSAFWGHLFISGFSAEEPSGPSVHYLCFVINVGGALRRVKSCVDTLNKKKKN